MSWCSLEKLFAARLKVKLWSRKARDVVTDSAILENNVVKFCLTVQPHRRIIFPQQTSPSCHHREKCRRIQFSKYVVDAKCCPAAKPQRTSTAETTREMGAAGKAQGIFTMPQGMRRVGTDDMITRTTLSEPKISMKRSAVSSFYDRKLRTEIRMNSISP